jgi:hypothetical protein
VNADPTGLAPAASPSDAARTGRPATGPAPTGAAVANPAAAGRGVTDPAARPVDDTSAGRGWLVRRWLATRALTVFLLVPETFEVLGDIRYYFRNVTALLAGGGLSGTLREYPAPSVGVFLLPRLVVGGHQGLYEVGFVTLMLAVDGAFCRALWRAAGRRPAPGVRVWLWFVPALGPLTFCRLDLVPAVLAGAALLAVARRPAWAGGLLGAGAAVKLWPLVLLPALWLHRQHQRRWPLLAGFVLVAATAGVAVAAAAGADRLTSPLTWQADRSLQLESYLALPLLVAGMFSPHTWHSDYTRFLAFEVVGPGVGVLLALATAMSVLAVAVLAVLWLRAALWSRAARRPVPPAAAGFLAIGTVCLLVITDKTLSPQYLVWVGALLAAMGVSAVDGQTAWVNRLMLAAAVLTQIVYPGMYGLLVNINPLAVVIVGARDAALVWLTWVALRRVWVLTRRGPAREGSAA